jgi:hypothetical protein
MNENLETLNLWGGIADEAIRALKSQIERLQKERDTLEADLIEVLDHVDSAPKQTWRPVSDPPGIDKDVYITDGYACSVSYLRGDGKWAKNGLGSSPKYWMPCPKLPDEAQCIIEETTP